MTLPYVLLHCSFEFWPRINFYSSHLIVNTSLKVMYLRVLDLCKHHPVTRILTIGLKVFCQNNWERTSTILMYIFCTWERTRKEKIELGIKEHQNTVPGSSSKQNLPHHHPNISFQHLVQCLQQSFPLIAEKAILGFLPDKYILSTMSEMKSMRQPPHKRRF